MFMKLEWQQKINQDYENNVLGFVIRRFVMRNLYTGQEATVRTGQGTTDWFKIGRGVCQGCILSPHLFNLYAEYIMQNARLDEAQAGIKIVEKNINNLKYADDNMPMAEREKELKSLLIEGEREE